MTWTSVRDTKGLLKRPTCIGTLSTLNQLIFYSILYCIRF